MKKQNRNAIVKGGRWDCGAIATKKRKKSKHKDFNVVFLNGLANLLGVDFLELLNGQLGSLYTKYY